MEIRTAPYRGWNRCRSVTNGVIELIVTEEVGPRVIRFARAGGENVFKEYRDMMGKTGGDELRIRGAAVRFESDRAQGFQVRRGPRRVLRAEVEVVVGLCPPQEGRSAAAPRPALPTSSP